MTVLGLGLIGIGRPWGHVPGDVPPEDEALAFLEAAWNLGIRFYDTAPSYGTSEERLGKFLRALTTEQRREATVATKFGEHWDAARAEPFVDHSFEGLKRSLDNSLERLGRVDLLQLHKTTPEVLRSADLWRAWDYALEIGVPVIGPSVADLESASLGIAEPRYGCMQLPLNAINPKFSNTVKQASERGMFVLSNRPFAMGSMMHGDRPASRCDAFTYVLEHRFHGAILTGTKNARHLEDNIQDFNRAMSALKGVG